MSSELTESEAIGHFQHWIKTARDGARFAMFDVRGPLRVVPALKNAAEAARAVGFLRNDENWLGYGKMLDNLVENRPKGWRPGNQQWLEVAGRLEKVRLAVERKFVAATQISVGWGS